MNMAEGLVAPMIIGVEDRTLQVVVTIAPPAAGSRPELLPFTCILNGLPERWMRAQPPCRYVTVRGQEVRIIRFQPSAVVPEQ